MGYLREMERKTVRLFLGQVRSTIVPQNSWIIRHIILHLFHLSWVFCYVTDISIYLVFALF